MPKKRLTTEEFINRSKTKFGDKFVYTDTRYVTQLMKVDLSCRVHGKFKILPSNHLKGAGCPKCSRTLNGFNHRITTEDYIKVCRVIHNNFYDYSKTVFTGSFQNIIVTCPVHGDFYIQANRHKNTACGCQKCGLEKRTRTPISVFFKKISKKKNYSNYDFSKISQFKNKFDSVIAICNTHGEYRTKPAYIENSIFFGCRKCKIDDSKHDTTTFIERSTKAHNGFYSYKNSNYLHAHGDITVTCPKHGDYLTKPLIHVLGGGFCPICTPTVSSYEKQLRAFLDNNYIPYEETFREFKDVKEVDIINHNIKLGIEFNGIYWHSDSFKEKNYHLKKTKAMNNLGYRLIHIFEDEWIEKRAICESIILNAFNKTKNKIYARNCIIKEVSANEAKDFLIHNHIQGNCISKYRYGLYHKNELVMLATFGKHRINLGSKAVDGEYELLRLSGLVNTSIVGGASKLLTFFITHHTPNQIISYCDKRYGTGNMYRKLGFKELYHTKPNYFYVRGNNRFNRFSYRKDILVSQGYDKSKTEKTIMNELGYRRIYDCGSIKFKWVNTFNNEKEALANHDK
jgi:very-short-patch-repair endonuclease